VIIYCIIAPFESFAASRNPQIGLCRVPGTPQEILILGVWAGAYADFQGHALALNCKLILINKIAPVAHP
jgi:hypothetical protein